jgi:hypothetical protein
MMAWVWSALGILGVMWLGLAASSPEPSAPPAVLVIATTADRGELEPCG